MIDIDAASFLQASLLERAVLLLQRTFREPQEPLSRLNVALAIANQASKGGPGVPGGSVLGGSRSPDKKVMRLVSEAWQVLESARLVCPDLSDSGDWWLLTGAGRQARDSSDPEGEIRLRLVGV